MEALCKVVIVDDEVLVRQGIKHLLQWEQEGFTIVGEASNGQEALKLIAQVQPHIVITDIVMPQMDGVELTSIVKERYPEIEIIILSSFSEFNYVRDTFQKGVADYILKPKLEADHLLSILKRTAKRIPSLRLVGATDQQQPNIHMLLDRLISGYADSVENADTLFSYPSFRIFGADLKLGGTQLKEQLLQRLEETFAPFSEQLSYYLLPTEEHTVAVLLNSNMQQWTTVIPAIRAIANSARWREGRLTWALGDYFSDLNELHMQYQHFIKLVAYRYFLPEERTLIILEELPKLMEAEPSFNMSQFMELLQQRKLEEAIGMIDFYMETASTYYALDVFAFKSLLGNIIFNLIVMLSKLEMNTKSLEANKYHHFRSINESTHITVVSEQMHRFIDEVNEVIASSRQTHTNANLTMIIEYIHQHYMEPINLSDVASHFHFNPSYLSSFFSSHHAEGFSEYLNRVRVDKAAELLQKTDQAIADISVQVGYSDHSYFTKVFKKLKGVSPSQYRKSYIK